MNLSKPLVSLLIVLLGLAVLVASLSAVQSRMNAIRIQDELTDVEPLENAPPMVAFTTVALGGFRGLVADFLWLRSQRMQEEGNYFETVQLASWITKLQPRFTAAAAFLAWNMAYNVSVTFSNPQDRWRWVQRGIELLRDEAMQYNPSDPELFQQLGWIYQHKMGKDLDDANRYYKTQMAWEMIRVFGPVVDQAGMTRWDLIGRGALTPAKLAAQVGKEKYQEFSKLLAGQGWTFDDFERKFRESPDGRIPESVRQQITELGIYPQVELCLRHRWLRNHYRLRPEVIAQLNANFGELDWRLPEAHAIYWAYLGYQEWRKSDDQFQALQCDRMIFQSLNAAFQGGRLVHYNEADTTVLDFRPNLAVVDSCRQAYENSLSKYEDSTIRGAYNNFMVDAVVYLYKSEFQLKAKQYFEDAKKADPYRFKGDLHTFAMKELAEDLKTMSYNQAASTIQGCLINSCHALALRQYDESRAYEKTAKSVYDKYDKDIGNTKGRRGLPPYPQMQQITVKICLEQLFPPELSAALKAELAAEKARQDEARKDAEDEGAAP